MNLEQTLEELRKLGYTDLSCLPDESEGWSCTVAVPLDTPKADPSGCLNDQEQINSDWHLTPLAAAQQCLERAKNVK